MESEVVYNPHPVIKHVFRAPNGDELPFFISIRGIYVQLNEMQTNWSYASIFIGYDELKSHTEQIHGHVYRVFELKGI